MVESICLGIVVAVMVDDRDGSARARNTGHLGYGRSDVAEVVRCETRTHEIEFARGEWYFLRRRRAGFH